MDYHEFIIPLSEGKQVTLVFQKVNDSWVCRMSDECKNDMDRLFQEHFGVKE